VAAFLLCMRRMGLARDISPGAIILLTRRTAERQFFLRPDDETNQILLYCLAVAAKRCNMGVILPSFLSDHHHTSLLDRDARSPEFTEHFHKLTARAMNALRRRTENLWSCAAPSVVRLVDRAAVMDKLVYAATNPVRHGLVERVSDWPGVNGLEALLEQRTITVKRPKYFFSPDGDMPEEETLDLVLPPELGDPDEFRRELRERVAAAEAEYAAERARTGRRVLGRRAILEQSWRDRPSTPPAPPGGLRPTIATKNPAARVAALQRNTAFGVAYYVARQLWLAGFAVIFPPGTYWLRRFARITVAEPVPHSLY
jgi:putative transposase